MPRRPHRRWPPTSLLCAALFACAHSGGAAEPCRIEIVDAENNWPVPLVELRTTHLARFVSDNNGIIASKWIVFENTRTLQRIESRKWI
ncbi:MAG: hypothetical protein WEA31_03975 [Pirellulales bacterium]